MSDAIQDAAQSFAEIGKRAGWVVELHLVLVLLTIVTAPIWVPAIFMFALHPLIGVLWLGAVSWVVLPAVYSEEPSNGGD